jgi:hypothetical protein
MAVGFDFDRFGSLHDPLLVYLIKDIIRYIGMQKTEESYCRLFHK